MFRPVRSALFVPGNRPDRIGKALATDADVVIIDLEDAVPESAKDETRVIVSDYLKSVHGRRVWVRCNGMDTVHFHKDIHAFVGALPECFMLPKISAPEDIRTLDVLFADIENAIGAEKNSLGIVPLIENAAGAMQVREIAFMRGRVERLRLLALGGADMALDLGLVPDGSGDELAYFRAVLPIASRAAGLEAPLDSPYMQDLSSVEKFRQDALRAKSKGFQGKLLVHPRQIAPCNETFFPSSEEIEKASKIAEAYRNAGSNVGALQVDGIFIDRPVVERSLKTLLRAGRI